MIILSGLAGSGVLAVNGVQPKQLAQAFDFTGRTADDILVFPRISSKVKQQCCTGDPFPTNPQGQIVAFDLSCFFSHPSIPLSSWVGYGLSVIC